MFHWSQGDQTCNTTWDSAPMRTWSQMGRQSLMLLVFSLYAHMHKLRFASVEERTPYNDVRDKSKLGTRSQQRNAVLLLTSTSRRRNPRRPGNNLKNRKQIHQRLALTAAGYLRYSAKCDMTTPTKGASWACSNGRHGTEKGLRTLKSWLSICVLVVVLARTNIIWPQRTSLFILFFSKKRRMTN